MYTGPNAVTITAYGHKYSYKMNACLMTPQHKNKLASGCQTNGIYIKSKNQICINYKFIRL